MSHDAINSWVEKAKSTVHAVHHAEAEKQSVRVITRPQPNIILELAEKIFPSLMKMFEGARDENGMTAQPAKVRGIALNVAQDIIKEQQKKASA